MIKCNREFLRGEKLEPICHTARISHEYATHYDVSCCSGYVNEKGRVLGECKRCGAYRKNCTELLDRLRKGGDLIESR